MDKNKIIKFTAVLTLIFALPSFVFATNLDFKNKEERKAVVQKWFKAVCEYRVKLYKKYPRIPVPKICKNLDQDPKPATLEFSIDKDSINEGESATISWASENAISCEASGDWSGEKTLTGEEVVSPLLDSTYTLTCDGADGGVEKSVSISVIPLSPIDVCPNIPEVQEFVPDGYYKDGLDCVANELEPVVINVVINEIAWMGSFINGIADTNAEWIEIRNLGNQNIDLNGWVLVSTDGTPSISINNSSCTNTIIPALGTFILVRVNSSILGVNADCTYTGALENTGEILTLSNASSEIIDIVNGIPNWEIGGAPQKGNNTTKETAQRGVDGIWFTAIPTPGSF